MVSLPLVVQSAVQHETESRPRIPRRRSLGTTPDPAPQTTTRRLSANGGAEPPEPINTAVGGDADCARSVRLERGDRLLHAASVIFGRRVRPEGKEVIASDGSLGFDSAA